MYKYIQSSLIILQYRFNQIYIYIVVSVFCSKS